MDTVEVTLAGKAINKRKFAMSKSEESVDEVIKAVLEAELENEDELLAALKKAEHELSEKGLAAVKGCLRMLMSFRDEMPDGIMRTLAEMAGLDYPPPEETDKAEHKDKEEYPMPIDKEAVPEPKPEAVSPEVKEKLDALWKSNKETIKKNDELKAELAAERDKRVLKEFNERVGAEFSHLPGMARDELAGLLKSIADKAPEDFAKLEGVLKSADQTLADSALLKEIGSDQSPVTGSAHGKLEAIAKGMAEKDPDLTHAQAYEKAMVANPQMYAEYLRDHPVQ